MLIFPITRVVRAAQVVQRNVKSVEVSAGASSRRSRGGHRSFDREEFPRGWWYPLLLSVPATRNVRNSSVVHAAEREAAPASDLTGTWIRDNDASDLASYDRMLSLMQLSGLQRTTALNLIEGLELERTNAGLTVRFLTVVPFFKVTEEVSFGKEVQQARRDLRSGPQMARAAPISGGVYIEMKWGEPVAGSLAETYRAEGDKLYVRSEVSIGGKKEDTTVVYRRSNQWRPRFRFPGT